MPSETLLHDIASLEAEALAIVGVLRSAGRGRDCDADLQHAWAARIHRLHQAAFVPIRRDLAGQGRQLPRVPLPFQRDDFVELRTASLVSQLRLALHRFARQLEAAAQAAATRAEAGGETLLSRQLRDWSRLWVGLEHRLDEADHQPVGAPALAALAA